MQVMVQIKTLMEAGGTRTAHPLSLGEAEETTTGEIEDPTITEAVVEVQIK